MRIGELSKKSGLSRDSIRFYERSGLIASEPSRSDQNTYRNYPDSLLDDLEMIVAARNVGFSIADLQMFIGSGGETAPDDSFLATKIAELEETLDQTRKLLNVLRQTQAAITEGPVEWRD